ncbi:thiol reductant ABC exporter subunit CydC [Actinopolymorpha sp. B11F2]|uniref:thiol reductant ABC exporter subunit CydC n=1 Tax=Actinopolymorpha sp. B11F2 TaxID=3160862 RepID=UPI0032E3AEA6
MIALRLALATVAGVAAAACAIALLATSAWLIAKAAEQPPVLALMVAIVCVRAFALGRGVLRYAERLLAHDAAYRLLGEVRHRTYTRLERLAPHGLAAFRSGDLMARLVNDVDAVLDLVLRVALPVIVAALAGTATVTLLALILPSAGGVAAVALGLCLIGVPWLVSRTGRRAERARAPGRGSLAARTTELLDAAPDLLAYGATGLALADLRATDRALRRAEARSAWSSGLGGALVLLLVGAITWSGLGLGARAVDSGELTPVLLAVLVLTPLALADVWTGLPLAAAAAGRSAPALARVRAIGQAAPVVREPAVPRALPEPPYHLRVTDLAVRWTPTAAWVFTGVNLDLPPGHRVALVGPTGCGKSTLAQALVRFVEPGRGSITVNGVDLRELSGDDVRRIVCLSSQEAYVFDTTVAENLRLARPDASEDEVRDALGKARLLTFVESLPAGLATRLGEHGVRMSGGQRQRLALARTLLSRAPVLILDEPTEHLDAAMASELTVDLLSAQPPDRTVVLVTHRPVPPECVDEVKRLETFRPIPASPADGNLRETLTFAGYR